MSSRTQGYSKSGRRIFWLAAATLFAIVVYTGFWFYLARTLEQRAVAAIAALNGGGVRAFCEEPQARGYPFRIGLFCRAVFYEDVRKGVSFRAGEFRSASQIYQPFHAVGELDGPATVLLPFQEAFEARWDNLRASALLSRPLPERLSVEGRGVVLSYAEGGDVPLARAENVQLHTRQQGARMEAAATLSGLTLDEGVAPGLPPLEGRMRITSDDGLLVAGAGDLRGRSAVIDDLVLGVAGEQAGITLSGPLAIGTDGLINAELSVRVEDPAAVARHLAQIFPELRDEIMSGAAMLGGFGDAPLPLRITDGRVFAGFIPLGSIPPL